MNGKICQALNAGVQIPYINGSLERSTINDILAGTLPWIHPSHHSHKVSSVFITGFPRIRVYSQGFSSMYSMFHNMAVLRFPKHRSHNCNPQTTRNTMPPPVTPSSLISSAFRPATSGPHRFHTCFR